MPASTHCILQNVANVYAEPNTASEMTTQALLGAAVTVAGEAPGFRRITLEDRYAGWVEARLLGLLPDTSDLLSATLATLFADVYAAPDARAEIRTKLTVGTHLTIDRRPEIGDWVPVLLPDAQTGYVHRVSLAHSHENAPDTLRLARDSGISHAAVVSAIGRQAAEAAKRFIGTPYLWGGCTPFGIDCSGLTQLAYKLTGVQLLRDAHLQFADRRFVRVEEGQGLETALLEDGDLVVFSRREDKRPTHIGLALGDGRFVHARGGQGVRLDFCEAPEYAATYLGAVRLSADAEFAVEAA